MASTRKILIADPDPSTVRALAPALRQRGYQVHAARDGARALQLAVLRTPDLVLFDEKAPLIDARTFVRILRTNPRTERTPVVLTGDSPDLERLRVGAFVRKPFRQDEVVARIEQIFRKLDAARAVSGDARDIEGSLAQIPLPDLLQILGLNRRTGRVVLERPGEKGEAALAEGRVVDAQTGRARGEKALYRLLTWREGQFAFVPTQNGVEHRIDRKLEDLVLEGLRQADEIARLLPSLPGPADLLELVAEPAEHAVGLHPVTQEVVALLSEPRLLSDVVDRAAASDLEALRALAALLEHGFVRRCQAPQPRPAEPLLLQPEELHALRDRVGRGRATGAEAVGKVLLAGGGPLARRAALARFATLPGFQPRSPAPAGFGALGRFTVGEGLRIDLFELPAERSQRPLWRPFAAGAVGLLLLMPAEGVELLVQDLSAGLGLPVVVCGPSTGGIPEAVRDAPGGVAFGGSDPAEALRALLAGAGLHRAAA